MEEKRQLEAFIFNVKGRKKSTEDFDFDLINLLFKDFSNFVNLLPNDEGLRNSVKIEKKKINDDEKSTLFVDSNKLFFSGKLSSTRYGEKLKIINTEDKDAEPVYETKPTDGVEKVFYFLIYFDKDYNRGMVLTERRQTFGIKGVFVSLLKSYFQEYFPEYICKVNSFIDRSLISNYINEGVAKQIILKTNKTSKDQADKLKIIPEESKDYIFELRIRRKGGFFPVNTNTIIKKLFDEKDKNYILSNELRSIGFNENSQVSVDFEFNNKHKNINLDESLPKPRSIYDIMVKIDSYGESDFESINKISMDKLTNICPFYNES